MIENAVKYLKNDRVMRPYPTNQQTQKAVDSLNNANHRALRPSAVLIKNRKTVDSSNSEMTDDQMDLAINSLNRALRPTPEKTVEKVKKNPIPEVPRTLSPRIHSPILIQNQNKKLNSNGENSGPEIDQQKESRKTPMPPRGNPEQKRF
jgi:hypothetical protein